MLGEDIDVMIDYVCVVGLVFQIQDDILDVIGNEEDIGKCIYKDSDVNKVIFVLLLGFDGVEDKVCKLVCFVEVVFDFYGEVVGNLCQLVCYVVECVL